MKANELMIGDWVVGPSKEPFRIGEINPDFVHWDEVRPVPLTEDILEKNGFMRGQMFNNVWNYTEDYKRIVIVYTGELFNIQNTLIEFKYIHELQHILRICGINKNIEL